MKILHAASEMQPLVSTGGLASVVGELPTALNRLSGVEASVVVPFYSDLGVEKSEVEWLTPQTTLWGEPFGLARVVLGETTVFLVAKDEYYGRQGVYGPTADSSWNDNPARFSFFCRAVSSLAEKEEFSADIVHSHDWQAALVPVYLRNSKVATVLTIHNLQFQGRYSASEYGATLLPQELYSVDGLEFWGDWSALKGGIVFADQLTTVSPTYAGEVLSPEFGWGLDGVLRRFSWKLTGILNGIDYSRWNPATDRVIPANYSLGDIGGKAKCRETLCLESGIEQTDEAPLLGMVTRLTRQKGIDLVVGGVDWFVEHGFRLVVLGTGESWAEKALLASAERYPGRVSVTIAYSDALARKIFSGVEAFLMPSAFEPCGLGQMMAMRYGAVPLVRSVGGLVDSVSDRSGFPFTGGYDEFIQTAMEMLEAWGNKRKWAWRRRRCMSTDFSWDKRVAEYMKVYRNALEHRNP